MIKRSFRSILEDLENASTEEQKAQFSREAGEAYGKFLAIVEKAKLSKNIDMTEFNRGYSSKVAEKRSELSKEEGL